MFDADGQPVWSNTDVAQANAVAFSPDGSRVTCVDRTNMVSTFQAKTGQPVWRTPLPTFSWCLAYRPDGSAVAVCPMKGQSVQLLRADNGRKLDVYPAAEKDVCGIDFRPDGKVLATVSFQDKSIRLWDGAAFKSGGTLDGHEEMVWSAAFSPDGKRLVSASLDKTVKIWDLDLKK
jgi:WD40 repeat protein